MNNCAWLQGAFYLSFLIFGSGILTFAFELAVGGLGRRKFTKGEHIEGARLVQVCSKERKIGANTWIMVTRVGLPVALVFCAIAAFARILSFLVNTTTDG